MSDTWDNTRAINYLTNFWEPRVGSQMLVDGQLGLITYIEPDYPDQVQISNSESIHYLQDIQWHPDIEEIYEVFRNLDIKVYDDCIEYNRILKPKPESIIEAAQFLADIRSAGLLNQKPLKI